MIEDSHGQVLESSDVTLELADGARDSASTDPAEKADFAGKRGGG